MKGVPSVLLFSAALACATMPAAAQELRVGANDTVESVLAAHKGKRVTVRLQSGQELTGVVRSVTARLAHIGTLSGKEFFDAVVPLPAVQAIIVRTRE
jgi:hypothetical protein